MTLDNFSERENRLFLRLRGASMAPALWPGDMLMARRRAFSDIIAGDIVVFRRAGRLIAHRVIGRDRDGAALLTRGDAATHVDQPVGEDRLLGVVEFVSRKGGAFAPLGRRSLGQRALAALLRHSSIASKALQRAQTLVWNGKAPIGAGS